MFLLSIRHQIRTNVSLIPAVTLDDALIWWQDISANALKDGRGERAFLVSSSNIFMDKSV